ncbi:inosine monophosphate dehydrogenase [Hortaea werneckii]|nr:inosine monophosphate dehydrogenase [Hortaea werneckii]KAI7109659.1 inosine monophosphate dehydrogenase [Hortaea werneckii]KAI7241842.1 inosine monophosphate dehydrogenase [Hortaea werneckii]KAI7301979.1 inosine monophosphate dehydrogenase [Hortaea werneckii]KAI7404649.1 inosine monophosphate dehydrogenase [Hortaea werneckii]
MSLQASFPWVKRPFIANAPMAGFANAPLAIGVYQAGGLGFVGSADDMSALSNNLSQVENAVPRHDGVLPIGVGFLPFIAKREEALPVLNRYLPAAVWLFAAKNVSDYVTWIQAIRNQSPGSQIIIQVGSVSAALQVAQEAHPDALCIQGLDAGGHGFEKGAGIITLFPEVSDALASAGYGDMPLLASGGIVCGRSAAAALALGAGGVVMGTRFLAATETTMHPAYRAAIFAAGEGGESTMRSKLFDELRGPNIWPEEYDGRSLVMESWKDHLNGVSLDEVRKSHAEAVKAEDRGYAVDGKGRAAIWAGSGVGLVRKEQSTAEILEDVRREMEEAFQKVRTVM